MVYVIIVILKISSEGNYAYDNKKKMIQAMKTKWGTFAWPITDVVDIIMYSITNNQIVLGGDILNKELEYTYDNWYYEPDNTQNIGENSRRSIEKAKVYISNYIKRNGGVFYVDIVISSEY